MAGRPEPYAVLMAGQLSERTGMALPLAGHPVFRRLVGGFDALTAGQFRRWVTTARQDEIAERFTAPSIMVLYDVVCGEVALAEWGPPSAVAGYSLGFYAAAVLARCVSARAVLEWLTRVNAANAARFPPGDFALASVTGVSRSELESLFEAKGLAGMRVANMNNPRQMVVAGPAREVEAAEQALAGVALDVKRVPLDVPLHTSHMDHARAAVAAWWELVPASAPVFPLLSSVTGASVPDGAVFKRHMLASLSSATDWESVARTLEEMGVRRALDVSPGGELGRMTRWTYRGLEVVPVTALARGSAR